MEKVQKYNPLEMLDVMNTWPKAFGRWMLLSNSPRGDVYLIITLGGFACDKAVLKSTLEVDDYLMKRMEEES